jgi:hypothetical protein
METVKGKPGGPNLADGERRHIEDGHGEMAMRVVPDACRLSDREDRGATADSFATKSVTWTISGTPAIPSVVACSHMDVIAL